MHVDYPPEIEAYRAEVRAWLEANLPAGWSDPGTVLSEDARAEFNQQWPKRLAEGGWVCATWPKEYGGKGLTTMEAVVVAEEFNRAGAPMRADFFGDTLVGPTILQWGTEEQKREFIPQILSGQIAWCQGFSEPDAGSDLGALSTTAVLDGDEWVINGQKIWTTQGIEADYIFVLCRTDPTAPKHKGISYLLCPMHQPGVEVRRIRQIDGGGEFCEVFFTDARWGSSVASTPPPATGGSNVSCSRSSTWPGPTAWRRIRPCARTSPAAGPRCRSCASTDCVRCPRCCTASPGARSSAAASPR
jgi:alkylation response protein AidB-like acyl-CoA dehydrogenase